MMEIEEFGDNYNENFIEEINEEPVKKKNYSCIDLEQALNDISCGMSVYAVAKCYNIPEATLKYRKNGKGFGKRGRKTIFSPQQEKTISEWLIKCAERGGPRTKDELLEAVNRIRQHESGDQAVGKQWLKLFMQRNQEISFRVAQPVTRSSACVSEDNIRSWFKKIYSYFQKEDLLHLLNDPSRWINSDETGFELNPRPGKVLAAKGSKNVNFVETAHPSERVSVMYTFGADGYVYSPQMILKNSVSGNKIVEIAAASVGEYIIFLN